MVGLHLHVNAVASVTRQVFACLYKNLIDTIIFVYHVHLAQTIIVQHERFFRNYVRHCTVRFVKCFKICYWLQ